MKITKNVFALLFCALTTSHFCKASGDTLQENANPLTEENFLKSQDLYFPKGAELKLSRLYPKQPSAIESASDSQKELLATFNQGDDHKTEKAANLALLLIANGPVKTAQREVAHATQTCQDGKTLMIIGTTIFTFCRSLDLLPLAPTSYYTDLRNSAIMIGDTVGTLTMIAGALTYQLGKSRLKKDQ